MSRQLLAVLCSTCMIFLLPAITSADDARQETIEAINQARRKGGRPALQDNPQLQQAAQDHAEWMARTGKMVHLQGEKPKGNDREIWRKSTWHPINRAIRRGYLDLEVLGTPNANSHIGENIAHGKPDSGPQRFRPQTIVDGWLKSEGHRKTIMGNYQDIGIGVMTIPNGDIYWCAVFGKP